MTPLQQLARQVPCWHVITTNGDIELLDDRRDLAILNGLELCGPNAQLISCRRVDQWSDAH